LKIRILLAGVALLLCFGGLCVPAFLAEKEGKENLLMIFPSEIGSPRIDVQKIEEFSKDEFLITYEIPSSERISLPQGNFPVTVIGTNESFHQIFGLKMLEGSFFSKQAWTGKQRHAVLNGKAAFEIFGSNRIVDNRFRIRNETWLVTGVIDDKDDEHSRVYVPSSIQNESANELFVLMSRGFNEAYIKNSIKNLEIREGVFNFFNAGTQVDLLWERVLIIPLLFFSLFFLGLMRLFIKKLLNALADLKEELNRHYTDEILIKNRKAALKPAVLALVLLALPSAALFLILRIVSIVLKWQDVFSITEINGEILYPHFANFYNFEIASRFLFGFTLFFLACLIFFAFVPVKLKKEPRL